MTYNHERAKVLCPEAAAEVERLRNVMSEAWIGLVIELKGPGDDEALEEIADLLSENSNRDTP